MRVHGRTRPGDWPAENLRAAATSGYTFPSYMLARSPYAGFDPDDYWLEPAPATAFVDEGDCLTIGDTGVHRSAPPRPHARRDRPCRGGHGVFFSGDVLYDGPLVDGLPESNVADFAASVARIRDLPISRLHGGHGPSISHDRAVELADRYLARTEVAIR